MLFSFVIMMSPLFLSISLTPVPSHIHLMISFRILTLRDEEKLCRYGENLDGLCELIPLERKGSGENTLTIVLLLFCDKLAIAAASEDSTQALRDGNA